MKRKISKFIIILLSILAIVTIFPNVSTVNASDIFSQADDWLEKGSQNPPITSDEVWKELASIAQMLMAVGAVVVVACFMWLGIKYMTTDPGGKADVKQKLIGLVIATVIVFGGLSIFTIVVNLFNGIFA